MKQAAIKNVWCEEDVLLASPSSEAKHTPDCLRLQVEAQAVLDAWLVAYPHYCRQCHTEGGRSVGGDLENPPDFIPCAGCLALGKCPRCHAMLLEDDCLAPCPECGWGSNSDPKPYVSSCFCPIETMDLEDWEEVF